MPVFKTGRTTLLAETLLYDGQMEPVSPHISCAAHSAASGVLASLSQRLMRI